MESSYQRFIKKLYPENTDDPYRLNSDGVTYTFVGKQFNLWKFFAHGILPYKKSTITSNWVLVGHGVAYSSCGSVIGKKCDNVSHHREGRVFRRYLKNSCHRRECPICYESWGSIEAERSLVRLASYVCGVLDTHLMIEDIISKNKRKSSSDVHKEIVACLEKEISKDGHNLNLRAIHVTISPRPDLVLDGKNYLRYRNYATKLLKRAGFHGGNLIFHEKRYHCAKCNASIPDYHFECVVCGCTDFVWVSSPHWHGLGFGWIKDTKEIYDKTGWIIKNLGVRKSVYDTMQYILSHATYYKDPESFHKKSFHITTWFGDLAYNRMPSIPKMKLIKDICPYCGLCLKRMEDDELGRFPPPVEFDHQLETFIVNSM